MVVQVQDDGPGLSPEMQKRLFEPFVSTKETGLGLGLSICRRLVEAHGGTIHGANAPEGGALFAFTLPVEKDHHKAERHRGNRRHLNLRLYSLCLCASVVNFWRRACPRC